MLARARFQLSLAIATIVLSFGPACSCGKKHNYGSIDAGSDAGAIRAGDGGDIPTEIGDAALDSAAPDASDAGHDSGVALDSGPDGDASPDACTDIDCFEGCPPWSIDVHGDGLTCLAKVAELVGGHIGMCALREDGHLACWGDNTAGQLSALAADADDNYKQVSSGRSHTCAVHTDGTLRCWGEDEYGQVSGPNQSDDADFLQVAVGDGFTCALHKGGILTCWGGSSAFTFVTGDIASDVAQVDASTAHFCALYMDGSLACWGYDIFGQVSLANADDSTDFVQIAAGWSQTCALRADGTLKCWSAGGNAGNYGVDGANADGGHFLQVSAGAADAICAVRTDSTIACWGADYSGEVSGAATAGDGFIRVAVAASIACGLRSNGTVVCWGAGNAAGIGGSQLIPGARASMISAGAYHTCVLHLDGRINCWGYDGDGITRLPSAASERFVHIAAGEYNTCAVTSSGQPMCWGTNQAALPPIGDGDEQFLEVHSGFSGFCGLKQDRTVMCASVPRLPGDDYTQITAGNNSWCGLHADGTASCSFASNCTIEAMGTVCTAAIIPGATDLAQIATGYPAEVGVCGAHTDGRLGCWEPDGTPVAIDIDVDEPNFIQVEMSSRHACALSESGELSCWGDDSYQQASVPPGEQNTKFKQISVGDFYTCGVRDDGSYVCWGGEYIDSNALMVERP